MYADDVCVHKKATNLRYARAAVQKHLSHLEGWTKKWRILINAGKTKCIAFTKQHNPKIRNLELYGQETGYTKRAVYQRATLHHILNWRLHCDKVSARALSSEN